MKTSSLELYIYFKPKSKLQSTQLQLPLLSSLSVCSSEKLYHWFHKTSRISFLVWSRLVSPVFREKKKLSFSSVANYSVVVDLRSSSSWKTSVCWSVELFQDSRRVERWRLLTRYGFVLGLFLSDRIYVLVFFGLWSLLLWCTADPNLIF
jgi:hypothetical protein